VGEVFEQLFDEGPGDPVVRPYLLTRGRTHTDLPLEAVVRAAPGADPAAQPPGELRDFVRWCTGERRAVAELAALARLPVQVTRVLVGDLVRQGTLTVAPVATPDDVDAEFVERIIRAVRRL
jgi:hypothetical protein